MLKLEQILENMWADYISFNPQAQRVYETLTQKGEVILNDHIALRTFNLSPLGLEGLASYFKSQGYQEKGEYHFEQKKLFAKHYEHPNSHLPKIFISELLVDQMSAETQAILKNLVAQVSSEFLSRDDISLAGRPWQVTQEQFKQLAKESEYAAWVAAHGFRPNHFTVNVNALTKFNSLQELNEFLISKGFELNQSGGLIKGTPAELLEQSSTMAEEVEVQFADGPMQVPGCYYEFAKRYALADGHLYTGFIAKSADKIFESTHAKTR